MKTELQTLMQQVVDTKITRNELLDLITHRVDSELSEQLADIQMQSDQIRFTIGDMLPLFRMRSDENVKLNRAWNNEQTYVRLVIDSMEISLADLPAKVRARYEQLQKLSAQRRELESKRSMLKRGKQSARIEMIRQSLSSTLEGQKVLAAIEELKDHVRDNILIPQLPERT
jgi:hypothetical protein